MMAVQWKRFITCLIDVNSQLSLINDEMLYDRDAPQAMSKIRGDLPVGPTVPFS